MKLLHLVSSTNIINDEGWRLAFLQFNGIRHQNRAKGYYGIIYGRVGCIASVRVQMNINLLDVPEVIFIE